MTVKATYYPDVPPTPDFATGKIVISNVNGFLVLVTGDGDYADMFTGTVLCEGEKSFDRIGEHHEWLKSSFKPFHGTITMESTP